MHSHNRSYSFSSWGKDSNYRSKSRDLPVEPLKKQYYYYNDNFQSIPSFGDSSIGYNDPSFSADFDNNLRDLQKVSTTSENEKKYRFDRSIDSKDELRKMSKQKIMNIDKINNKIKKILDTLNEEEKKISSNNFKLMNKSNNRKYGERIKTEGDLKDFDHHQETMYSRLQNIKQKYHKNDSTNLNILQDSVAFGSNQNNRKKQRIKTDFEQIKDYRAERNFARNQSIENKENYAKFKEIEEKKMSRSKLYFENKESQKINYSKKDLFKSRNQNDGTEDSFTFHENSKIKPEQNMKKKSNGTPSKIYQTPIKNETSLKKSYLRESCVTKKGRNIDEEIIKIQEKIASFEKIKKDLDIDYSPVENKLITHEFRRTNEDDFFEQNNNFSRISSQKVNEYCQEEPISFKCERNMSFESEKKVSEEVNIPKPFKMNSKRGKESNIYQKPIVPSAIESQFVSEDRKFVKDNTEIHQLLKKLCQQIEIDDEFRNQKKWFAKKTSPYKWVEVVHFLSSKNINMNEAMVKEIFTLTEEEDNPFYTKRESQGSISNMVDSFIKSENHWSKEIKNKFNKKLLEDEGIHQMDICKEGKINLEDIVRYINVQSDNYFRNRDLSLIYRRFSQAKGSIVTMQNLLNEICF